MCISEHTFDIINTVSLRGRNLLRHTFPQQSDELLQYTQMVLCAVRNFITDNFLYHQKTIFLLEFYDLLYEMLLINAKIIQQYNSPLSIALVNLFCNSNNAIQVEYLCLNPN